MVIRKFSFQIFNFKIIRVKLKTPRGYSGYSLRGAVCTFIHVRICYVAMPRGLRASLGEGFGGGGLGNVSVL